MGALNPFDVGSRSKQPTYDAGHAPHQGKKAEYSFYSRGAVRVPKYDLSRLSPKFTSG